MIQDRTAEDLQRIADPAPLPRKIGSYLELEPEDMEALRELGQRRTTIGANREIIGEGDAYTRIYVLQEGWAIRHKSLRDGRRQIVNIILPGDFFCLNAVLFSRSHYGISTIAPVVVSSFAPTSFRKLALRRPHLAMAVAWCNAREEAMMAERVTSIARRSAYERIAHMIVELCRRLEIVGLAKGRVFDMPLRQLEVGDALGLSVVHVSRTLQRLREEGLADVDTRSRRVLVKDWEGLMRAGGLEGGYLYFTELPRAAHV